MKKLLIALAMALWCASVAVAQVPPPQTLSYTYTGATTSSPCVKVQPGVRYFMLTWNSIGTVSAGTVKLEKSAAGPGASCGSFSDVIAATTATSSGTTTITSDSPNFVRITGASISGGGSIEVTMWGWTVNPFSTTVTATNLDVQIGGSDSLTIGTFPDNEPFNVAQLGGNAINLGSGTIGTGTLRMTIATDDPVNDAAVKIDAGTALFKLWDGTDTALVSAGGELSVSCGNCSGSGVSHVDGAAFTADSDDVVPFAAIYDTTPGAVSDGDAGAVRMTSERVLMVHSDFTDSADNAAFAYTSTEPPVGTGCAYIASPSDHTDGDKAVCLADIKGRQITVDSNLQTVLGTASLILATQADDVANTSDGLQVTSFNYVFDGTTWDRAKAASAGSGTIDAGTQRITIATDDPVNDAAVKIDAGTALFKLWDGTDTALVSAGGELSVSCGNCSGSGASHVDDAAFTNESDDGVAIFAQYDTTPDAIDDGDAGIVRMNSSRVLMVDGSGVTQPVSGTVTANLSATDNAVLDDIADGIPVTNAGTFAVQVDGAALTSLQLIDDAVFSDDAAFTPGTSKGLAVGFQVDDTGTDSVDEGDFGVPRMSANRVAYNIIRDAAGNERGANVTASNELLVNCGNCSGSGVSHIDDAAFTVDSDDVVPVAGVYQATPDSVNDGDAGALRMTIDRILLTSADTEITTAATLADDTANPSAGGVATYEMVFDGTTWDRARAATAGTGTRDSGTMRITQATNDESVVSLALLDDTVFTDDAGFTPATSKGLAVGFQVDESSTDSVDEGDFGVARMSADRMLYTRQLDPCSGKAKTFFVVNLSSSGTTEIANAVSGEFFYICSINIVTAAANNILIAEDDTDGCGSISAGLNGGTTSATGWNFAANGGIAMGNGNSSIMKTGTANRYFCIAISASTQTSGTISYVSAP